MITTANQRLATGTLGHTPWLLGLIVAGLVLRVVVTANYPNLVLPDSPSYIQAARDLLSWDFSLGQGRRTAGYPLVIALVGPQALDRLVWFNVVCGLATAMLCYATLIMLGVGRPLAFAAGMVQQLNLQQLFQEPTVSTEPVSATSVAAVAAMITFAMRHTRGAVGPRSAATADAGGAGSLFALWLGLGLLAAYTIHVRPQFVFLLLMLPAAAWLAAAPSPRRWWLPTRHGLGLATAVALPIVVSILAWCAVMKAQTGYFTMSNQSGFGMVNHAIDNIELAGDRWATPRDVLLRTREARIAQAGHSRNTIWYAWPEMQKLTGWSLPEASREMQAMSVDMFKRHPVTYLRSVASAWIDFWTVPIFWRTELIEPPTKARLLEAVWWVEHKLLRGANAAFMLALLAAVAWPAFRRRVRWDLVLTALSLVVIGSSLVQSLFDQGASSRYHLPTQGLVVTLLVALAGRWRSAAGSSSAPVGPGEP